MKPMFSLFEPLRILNVVGIALLQVAIAPLTYVVHIGCHHDARSSTVAPSCSGHAHCHHHRHGGSQPDKVPDHSHDSDNCPVCQVAFAAQIAGCPAAGPPATDLTVPTPVSAPQVMCIEFRYTFPVRGPPVA